MQQCTRAPPNSLARAAGPRSSGHRKVEDATVRDPHAQDWRSPFDAIATLGEQSSGGLRPWLHQLSSVPEAGRLPPEARQSLEQNRAASITWLDGQGVGVVDSVE